jgi:multidrug efflux pump subunit AcrB
VEVELKRVRGTRDVSTIGGPGHVLRVLMDPGRMNGFGVTPQDLKGALLLANASQPSGTLTAAGQEVLVQTGTYIASADDVKRLVVGVSGGKPVTMADVARVVDGPDQPSRFVWHGLGKGSVGSGGAGRALSGSDPVHLQEAGRERGRRGQRGDPAHGRC